MENSSDNELRWSSLPRGPHEGGRNVPKAARQPWGQVVMLGHCATVTALALIRPDWAVRLVGRGILSRGRAKRRQDGFSGAASVTASGLPPSFRACWDSRRGRTATKTAVPVRRFSPPSSMGSTRILSPMSLAWRMIRRLVAAGSLRSQESAPRSRRHGPRPAAAGPRLGGYVVRCRSLAKVGIASICPDRLAAGWIFHGTVTSHRIPAAASAGPAETGRRDPLRGPPPMARALGTPTRSRHLPGVNRYRNFSPWSPSRPQIVPAHLETNRPTLGRHRSFHTCAPPTHVGIAKQGSAR